MNKESLDKFFVEIGQHYPNSTSADLEMVGEAVKNLSFEQAMTALRSIRLSEKLAYRPSIPKFVEKAKAIGVAARPAARIQHHKEIVHFIHSPASRGADAVRGVDDPRAIEIHFRKCWEQAQIDSAYPTGIASMRRLIFAHCKAALMQIGWSEPDAMELSRMVVDLGEGEKLAGPTKLFNSPPKPAAISSFEAIKGLAIAEHQKSDEPKTSAPEQVSRDFNFNRSKP